MNISANNVLRDYDVESLQYSTTEGYEPLREIIAKRYVKFGLDVDVNDILITTGSQQCLDLVAKVFLDKGDIVLVENPTYLAALQAFSVFEVVFKTVPLCDDSVDLDELEEIFKKDKPKLFYAIPSFQNPTGTCYSSENREKLAVLLERYDVTFVEDNPYGEIRFMGDEVYPVKHYYDESILFGSFSKIVSPGMRIGWVVAKPEIIDKFGYC